jgi:hypothetical protein
MWYPLGTRRRSRTLGRSFVFACSPERPYRKEFVAAGDTTVGWKSHLSAKERCLTRDMFCRDALQVEVAADSAVRVQQIPKRNAAPVKSRFARFTSPRQNPANAKQIVKDCPAPGPPEIRTAARWTNELGRLDFRSPLSGWTLKHGKKQTLFRQDTMKIPRSKHARLHCRTRSGRN